jgi:hypothetical protein
MTFNLNSDASLKIGFGSGDYFYGRMREVRLYHRALDEDEIARLVKQ